VLWSVTARAVRLGYNVLALDADCGFHYDIYAILKAPPYANHTWIWQDEGWPYVNSGIM
jgi:hypothetical protein